MSYSTKRLVAFKVKGSAFLFNVEEKPAHAYRDGKRETCHQEASYGSVTIVCDEHKWGLRIGTDNSQARPFTGLKFYGLEARPLGEAGQYK